MLDEQLTSNQLLSLAGCWTRFGINAMNDSENAVAGSVAVGTLIRRDFRSKMLCALGRKPKCSAGAFPAWLVPESMHCRLRRLSADYS